MVFELKEPSKARDLFAGWEETLIYSCLQGVMGKIYVTDTETPQSAFAFVGVFGFYAGEPDRELIRYKPEGFVILTPQNEQWAQLIEETYPDAKKMIRYAIRKDTVFDTRRLKEYLRMLPEGYELREADAELYEECMKDPVKASFVSVFADAEQYLRLGRGMFILKDGQIVAGASSYTRYREGIELEVYTSPEERRKHLALVCCSALILRCLEEGLYPSWDASNPDSVRLAKKLGYELSHEYFSYAVASELRTY